MANDILPEIVSSGSRLKIADLLSIRPRTLKELSYMTGISVQAVLKHLARLQKLGLLEERKVSTKGVRKVYRLKAARVGDFSVGDLSVVKLTRSDPPRTKSSRPAADLEYFAEDSVLLRRRVKDQAKRLGRTIDELVDNQAALDSVLDSLKVSDTDRLILQTVFTEETMADAEKALARHHGLGDARKSIDKAMAKAKRSA